MVQYVEVEIDGQNLKFEMGNDDFSGERAVSNVPQRIRNLFPEIQGTIQGISSLISNTVSSLSNKPSETEVEFGINVKAEVGAMIANSSMEAQIKISLKWTDN